MNLKQFKERLDFEIGYEEDRIGNSPALTIPDKYAENLDEIRSYDYQEGFIDGLKRAEELTDPKN